MSGPLPGIMNKSQLADAAKVLAQSFGLVQRGATTFIPVDWETHEAEPPPPEERRIWQPLTREDKLLLSNKRSQILFSNDGEFRSFDFMLRQVSSSVNTKVHTILVKTKNGLRALDGDGRLVEHDGTFTPNYVRPLLNEDPDDKQFVFDTIRDWLNSEEEAVSLLHHLATSLAPNYSAVKYVLLLGEGRNGKSVLLSMLAELFGKENVSNVSRQMMAERSPTCVELNDKLLNVIFDGEMAYIKDSSMEKTLIAGERGVVRMLYESGTTPVQTNALFIEALNREPAVRDKSAALQKRLVRFRFPNVYSQDKAFFKKMTGDRMLGALLALLVDHYVPEDDIAEKLKLTAGSVALELEQVWFGSPVLQFLEHLTTTDPTVVDKLQGMAVDTFFASFKPWADTQGLQDRTDADLLRLLNNSFELGWHVTQKSGKPLRTRVIFELKPETTLALQQLKGEDSA